MNVVRWVLFAGTAGARSDSDRQLRRIASARSRHLRARRKQAKYHCPMHPSYTSDRNGECPICGMDLEPIPIATARDSSGTTADVPGARPGAPLARAHPDDRRAHRGRRAARARDPDWSWSASSPPTRPASSASSSAVSGWVQELYVRQTGERSRPASPCSPSTAPSSTRAQQEFLIETGRAARTRTGAPERRARRPAAAPLAPAARACSAPAPTPRSRGSSASARRSTQIAAPLAADRHGDRAERGRGPVRRRRAAALHARRPVAGVGAWPTSTRWTSPGCGRASARRSPPTPCPARTFAGRVEFVYPTVIEPETRTLKVRVSLDRTPRRRAQARHVGRVRLRAGDAGAGACPTEAVIYTGRARLRLPRPAAAATSSRAGADSAPRTRRRRGPRRARRPATRWWRAHRSCSTPRAASRRPSPAWAHQSRPRQGSGARDRPDHRVLRARRVAGVLVTALRG